MFIQVKIQQSKSSLSYMLHTYLYMSLPKIFKLSQTVWPAQDFSILGESESTLEHDICTGPNLGLFQKIIISNHIYKNLA